MDQKLLFVVGVLSTSFARTLLGLIHLHGTFDLKSNPMDSSHFENNFKRTINCPATRANMNEPSKQRTDWRYHFSVTYVTNNGEVIMRTSYVLLRNQRYRATILPARIKANGNFIDASVERLYSVRINRLK